MDIKEQKSILLKRLDVLKLFPNNNEVRILRSRTQKALERLEKLDITPTPIPSKDSTRSSSLKKHHRYIRLIRDNFPDLKYLDIRRQFGKRKRGQEVSIPDAVWQNPSP